MRNQVLRILLHVTVWLAIYLLPYSIAYGQISTSTLFREPGDVVHAVSTVLLIAYAYLNYYRLVPVLYLHRKYVAYAVCVLAGVLLVIWFPNVFRPVDHGAFTGPPPAGQLLRGGQPPLTIFRLSYNVLLFVVCTLVSINIRQQRQLLEMQKEKLDAELSFLKAQINPHFLFNTLNSIYALAIQKSDDTPKAILQLSELMRYILKDSDADVVPLEREINYIGNYVTLQKRRLGNTVQIEYSAPAARIGHRIAPLILMSFVENAFKHGVNPGQDSVITISIVLQNEQLHLSVSNKKVTTINRNETMGIGLKNAIARLEHQYPGRHRLTIDDGEQTFSVNLFLELHD